MSLVFIHGCYVEVWKKPLLFFVTYDLLQCHICKRTGMQKKITPSAETVFRNSCVSKQVEECIRFYWLNHFIGFDEKKSRCALCGKISKCKCTKCDFKLHDYCFSTFHGPRELCTLIV